VSGRRWQKGKDVYWYTRDVDRSDADKAAELAMVKQREQDLMMEVSMGVVSCVSHSACLLFAACMLSVCLLWQSVLSLWSLFAICMLSLCGCTEAW
jgi:hypothetical protein